MVVPPYAEKKDETPKEPFFSRYLSPSFLFTSLFCIFIAYFFYHAMTGELGGLALIRLSQQVQKKQLDFENIHAERLNLEHKVKLLRPNSLDLDFLEERARAVLGICDTNETIYWYEKSKEK